MWDGDCRNRVYRRAYRIRGMVIAPGVFTLGVIAFAGISIAVTGFTTGSIACAGTAIASVAGIAFTLGEIASAGLLSDLRLDLQQIYGFRRYIYCFCDGCHDRRYRFRRDAHCRNRPYRRLAVGQHLKGGQRCCQGGRCENRQRH